VSVTGGADGAGEQSQRPAAAVADAFDQLPTPMAATEGPRHVIVAANAACRAFAFVTRAPCQSMNSRPDRSNSTGPRAAGSATAARAVNSRPVAGGRHPRLTSA
jgi:hypothetical protein